MAYSTKFFKEYYKKKLKSRNRFGEEIKKKEALCIVIIKFIKVVSALLRDNRKFEEKRPVFV